MSACWVVPCDAPVEFRMSSPWVPLVSSVDSCAFHLGDLLGNAAKSALRTAEQGSVTLQVNCTRPCHANPADLVRMVNGVQMTRAAYDALGYPPPARGTVTPAEFLAAEFGNDVSEWEV